LVQSLIRRAI